VVGRPSRRIGLKRTIAYFDALLAENAEVPD
jgi:hypothetical protein